MARFVIGRPIATETPSITVDAGLPMGAHRFQLEVIDAAGNRSAPDVATVTVRDPAIPTDPTGPTIPGPAGPTGPTIPGTTGPVLRPDALVTPVTPATGVVRPDITRPGVVATPVTPATGVVGPGVVQPGVTGPRTPTKPRRPPKGSKPK
jgi:hypothetical protein